MQVLVLTGRPLGEENCPRLFPTKKGAQGLFESPTEQHCRTRILLLPAIEIAVPITPRASEVLADLGVAVGHSGHLRIVEICRGKFFPAAGRSKTVESEQGSAVKNNVTDFDHTPQTND